MKHQHAQGANSHKKDSTSKIISIFSLIVSAISMAIVVITYYDNLQKTKYLQEVEVRDLIDQAWDLIGGVKGAESIQAKEMTTDKERECFEQARRIIENNVFIKNPNHLRAIEVHGVYYAQLGKIDKAVSEFRKVIQLDPKYYKVYNNLGAALFKQGNFDEAIIVYQRAIELEPSYALAHNGLGNAFQKKDKLAEAEKEYREAIKNNRNYAEAYNSLGGVLHSLNRHQEEENMYRMAIDIKRDYVEAYKNLYSTLKELNKLYEADEMLNKAQSLESMK